MIRSQNQKLLTFCPPPDPTLPGAKKKSIVRDRDHSYLMNLVHYATA